MKKEDLTLSFLRSLAEVQGHLAHVHALAHQVRKVYFIGGFINMDLMRRFLYQEINGRNFARPEVNKNVHPTTKSTNGVFPNLNSTGFCRKLFLVVLIVKITKNSILQNV